MDEPFAAVDSQTPACGEWDQLTTRSDARFVELRSHVHARIQRQKVGGS